MTNIQQFTGWLVVACLTAYCFPARAQEQKVIVLEHADSLEGRTIDGVEARELIGHISIRQEKVRITCDRALQYVVEGRVLLNGNVVVRDDSVTMTAPRGVYRRDQRLAEAFDDVHLDDGTTTLTAGYGRYYIDPQRAFFRSDVLVRDSTSTVSADSLTYFRPERRSIAEGHVVVHSSSDNTTITGGRLEHNAATLFSRMTIAPALVQLDSSTDGRIDTLVVRSTVMEAYRDSTQRFVAIDSVRIARCDLAGRSALAVFFTRGDSIILRKGPVLWYQETQVSGDSMNVYLSQRRLRRIFVSGDAFAISRSDSLHPERFDQLAGETMRMDFGTAGLSRIDVEIRAISVYHLYEDSVANGLNKTSGDRIVLLFHEGKVNAIKVIGGIEGQYFPEKMVRRREEEYMIPGFLWRSDRPTLSSLRPSTFPSMIDAWNSKLPPSR
jgi:lipopolysaccharide export system protein LptA